MIQKPYVHETKDKFLRGVRHIRLFKQKNGTKFRFCLEPLRSDYLLSPSHAGMYIPANMGAGTGPCRGVGQSPASLNHFLRQYNFFFM